MRIILNIFRNSHIQNKEWPKVIHTLWNIPNSVFRRAVHCNSLSSQTIVESFQLINTAYQKNNRLKIHAFSLEFEQGTSLEDILAIVNATLSYFIQDYQIITNVFDDMGSVKAVFVLNAACFHCSGSYHDNNQSIALLFRYLKKMFGPKFELNISDRAIFQNCGANLDNYYAVF